MIRLSFIAAVAATALLLAACGNPAGPPGQYGTIKGTITSAAGQPIAGATILIDYTINATSKTDGSYQADLVPSAPASAPAVVTVSAPGYQSQTRTDIVVQVGQPTVVNFTLAPG
ncbi:MAG TPA: carboxypeptidase-like regulatory domain-containing protein [Candidatus Eremiobacteraceae bacterium]|nr:carboxypeptidase-like regulatory domain-containing protein [Candidatus Eremiobacteraceae bacterium]